MPASLTGLFTVSLAYQASEFMRVGAWLVIGMLLARSYGSAGPTLVFEQVQTISLACSFSVVWALTGWLNSSLPKFNAADSVAAQRDAIGCTFVLAAGIGGGLAWFAPLPLAVFQAAMLASACLEVVWLSNHKRWHLLLGSGLFWGTLVAMLALGSWLEYDVATLWWGWAVVATGRVGVLLLELHTLQTTVKKTAASPAETPASRYAGFPGLLKALPPLVGSALLGGSHTYVQAFWVHQFLEPSVFTLFRYASREVPFIVAPANALSAINTRRAAASEPDWAAIRQSSGWFALYTAVVCLTLLATSTWLFEWLYGPSFRAAALCFDLFTLIALTRMAFPQSILLAIGRTDILFRTSVLELIVLLVCSGLCVWQWGLPGAGLASLVGNVFEKAILAWRLSRTGIPPRYYLHLVPFGTAVLVVLVAFFLKYAGFCVYM